MVEEVVGHLLEQRVGVEVEADLRAVPARMAPTCSRLMGSLIPSGRCDFRVGSSGGARVHRRRRPRAGARSDWFAPKHAGLVPPSGEGNGFGTRYAEDFELSAARAAPPPLVDRVGADRARGRAPRRRAIEHYREVLTAAHAARESPVGLPASLHAFRAGSPRSAKASSSTSGPLVLLRPRHVAFCAETFGDLVYGWKPINEPAAYSMMYRPEAAGAALDWETSSTARQRCCSRRRMARAAWRRPPGRDDPQPLAVLRGRRDVQTTHGSTALEQLTWKVWMRAIATACSSSRARRVPDLQEACDLVGFSYYSATGVDDEGGVAPYPAGRASGRWATRRGAKASASSCATPATSCPAAVARLRARRRHRRRRMAHRRRAESLRIVADAIADGIDVRGFFHWTGVDNYEWNYGFDVQFGCVHPRPRAAARARAGSSRRHPTPPATSCRAGAASAAGGRWRPPTASLLRRLVRCRPSRTNSMPGDAGG